MASSPYSGMPGMTGDATQGMSETEKQVTKYVCHGRRPSLMSTYSHGVGASRHGKLPFEERHGRRYGFCARRRIWTFHVKCNSDSSDGISFAQHHP